MYTASLPNVRKWMLPFFLLKIFCFFVSYILLVICILSFFWDPIYQYLNILVNGEFRPLFGIYLIITGFSCFPIAYLLAETDVIKDIGSRSTITTNDQRKFLQIKHRVGYIIQGLIFLLSGFLVLLAEPNYIISQIWIFILLILPSFAGAFVKQPLNIIGGLIVGFLLMGIYAIDYYLNLSFIPALIGQLGGILALISGTGSILYQYYLDGNDIYDIYSKIE